MTKQMMALATVLALTLPLSAQNKEEERLGESASVLQLVLAGDLPVSILNKADCVLVFPNVREVAIGIGGSYGRGALVCRKPLVALVLGQIPPALDSYFCRSEWLHQTSAGQQHRA